MFDCSSPFDLRVHPQITTCRVMPFLRKLSHKEPLIGDFQNLQTQSEMGHYDAYFWV